MLCYIKNIERRGSWVTLITLIFFALSLFLLAPVSAHAAAPTGFEWIRYEDTNGNGTVNLIRLKVNGGETLASCTVIDPDRTSDWAYTGGSIGGSIGAISCDNADAIINIQIMGANPRVTGHTVAPTISYNNDDGDNSIANSSGVLGNVGPVDVADGAAPQIGTLSYNNIFNGAEVDGLFITFTEPLHENSILRRSHLNFTNPGDLTGINFGAGEADMIVIADQWNSGLAITPIDALDTHDDSGNLAFETVIGDGTMVLTDGTNENTAAKAQTQATIFDNARPVIVSVTPEDEDVRVNRGERLVIRFSEAMAVGFEENVQFTVSPNVDGAVWTAVWSENNHVVTLTSNRRFKSKTEYTVTIDEGEVNAAGGEETRRNLILTGPVNGVWSFTTKSAGRRVLEENVIETNEENADEYLEEGVDGGGDVTSDKSGDPAGDSALEVSENPTHFQAGNLVKGESHAAVYLIGKQGERRPFLNSVIFFTWFDSFDDVHVISDDILGSLKMGSPVLPKEQVVLVTFESISGVYVLLANGAIREIANEELATRMYGEGWREYIIDIPVTLRYKFTEGDIVERSQDIVTRRESMRRRDWLSRQ